MIPVNAADQDPATLTPPQARINFQYFATELSDGEGKPSWQKAKFLKPELFARGFGEDQPAPPRTMKVTTCSDSNSIIKGLVPPSPYPSGGVGARVSLASALMLKRPVSLPNEGNIEALGLPPDATFEEFRAADSSNSGAVPRDSVAIFEALVGLLVETGMSVEAARAAATEKYPVLAAEAVGIGVGQVSPAASYADTIATLGLPADAPADIAVLAVRLNGGASPPDFCAVLNGLTGYLVGQGLGLEAADTEARSRFPALAQRADLSL